MAGFKLWWKRFSAGYVRFVERQGFFVILIVCVSIIAGTAAWTNRTVQPVPAPTPPVGDAAQAARLHQQSLRDAATPTPAPTQAPVVWHTPLESLSVLRSFDAARLVPSKVTGLWQLHDALDLRCTVGEQIRSMADGTVLSVSAKGLQGAAVTIDHGKGIVAEYAGLSMLAGLRVGDPVEAEQVIGFGGNGVMDESDLEPHLHLRVTRDGQAIDPLLLLRSDD